MALFKPAAPAFSHSQPQATNDADVAVLALSHGCTFGQAGPLSVPHARLHGPWEVCFETWHLPEAGPMLAKSGMTVEGSGKRKCVITLVVQEVAIQAGGRVESLS